LVKRKAFRAIDEAYRAIDNVVASLAYTPRLMQEEMKVREITLR
jgi:hypothetical protein